MVNIIALKPVQAICQTGKVILECPIRELPRVLNLAMLFWPFVDLDSSTFRRYVICGDQDGSNKVNYSTLTTSCSNAMRKCSTAECIRAYVQGAFDERIYKFCPNQMNLMVTAKIWASSGYGIEHHSGDPYDCIAYCVPKLP